MALASPGTGLLELLAFAVLVLAGLGTLRLPLDLWALLVIALGAVAFFVALRGARHAGLAGALGRCCSSAGSAFLFGDAGRRPAVHPLLAVAVSVLTVGLFWLLPCGEGIALPARRAAARSRCRARAGGRGAHAARSVGLGLRWRGAVERPL